MTDVGKVRLEGAANAGEVRVDRAGVDMVRHKDNEEAEGVRGGLNREIVDGDEFDI